MSVQGVPEGSEPVDGVLGGGLDFVGQVEEVGLGFDVAVDGLHAHRGSPFRRALGRSLRAYERSQPPPPEVLWPERMPAIFDGGPLDGEKRQVPPRPLPPLILGILVDQAGQIVEMRPGNELPHGYPAAGWLERTRGRDRCASADVAIGVVPVLLAQFPLEDLAGGRHGKGRRRRRRCEAACSGRTASRRAALTPLWSAGWETRRTTPSARRHHSPRDDQTRVLDGPGPHGWGFPGGAGDGNRTRMTSLEGVANAG